jgi:glucan-binding repeat-containing protein
MRNMRNLTLCLIVVFLTLMTTNNVFAATGWVKKGTETYYYKSNGTKAKGWQTINKKKYYFRSTGKMAKGWLTLSTGKYYFKSNGKMAKGWKTINKKKYYFRSTGKMAKGWLTLGSTKYYFKSDGTLAKSVRVAKTISIDNIFQMHTDSGLTAEQRLAAHNKSMKSTEDKYYIEQLNREFDKYIQGAFNWDYRNQNNKSNYLAFRTTEKVYDHAPIATDKLYEKIHQKIKDHQLVITPSFNYEIQDIYLDPARGGYTVSQVLKLKYTSANGSRIEGWEPNTWHSVRYEVRFAFPGEIPSWKVWNYGDYGYLAAGFDYRIGNWK